MKFLFQNPEITMLKFDMLCRVTPNFIRRYVIGRNVTSLQG